MAKRTKVVEPLYTTLREMEKRMGLKLFGDYIANLTQTAEILSRPYLGETINLLGKSSVKTLYWIFHALEDSEGGIPSADEILARAIGVRDYFLSPEILKVSLDNLASEPELEKRAKEIWRAYPNFPSSDGEFGKGCLRFEYLGRSIDEAKKAATKVRNGLQESNSPLDLCVNFDESLDDFITKLSGNKIIQL